MPPTLVRLQTFDSLQSPDPASPAVQLEISNLTLWLKDFTLTSTPVKNLISSVFQVLIANLVFVNNIIVQQLQPLTHKDYVSKLQTYYVA